MFVNGILLLYHRPLWFKDATTVQEHIGAFQKYSQLRIWSINTALGFPPALRTVQFSVLVFHYSLFGYPYENCMDSDFFEYLDRSQSSYKIAFFQDEHHFCQPRFRFLSHYMFDCVYTLVEPPYFKETYQKYTKVPKLVYTLPGYVGEELVAKAHRLGLPDEKRQIDIGYRGRSLKYYMGRGSQEKYKIAVRFSEKASGLGLKLDIKAEDDHRIYGHLWYRFLANCRAVLGVEAGVSIFDIEDLVRTEYEKLMALDPHMSFEELTERILGQWENNIPYRTISPRHFESAAFRNCQILFEGKYSGIMQPMVHYIPLKKDFSNFEEVIGMFQDKALRHDITKNAYCDMIASGRYSYERFIESFDKELLEVGLEPDDVPGDAAMVTSLLNRWRTTRKVFLGARKCARLLGRPRDAARLVRRYTGRLVQILTI